MLSQAQNRSSVSGNRKSTSFDQLQEILANKYINTDPINQIEHIKSQYQILSSIKKILQKRKYINMNLNFNQIIFSKGISSSTNNILDEFQTSSQMGNSTIICQQSFDQQGIINSNKSKFTEQMQKSSINNAMREVQANCSPQTFQVVKQSLIATRIKESENFEKITSKLIEQRDQLLSQIQILKLQKTGLQKQLQKYKKIALSIDEEKKNIKKKVDYVLKKQNQVFKLQSSFAFKQKINLQLKKRYERLVGSYLTNEAKLENIYKEIDRIWNMICTQIQKSKNEVVDRENDCTGNCWRKNIIKRAKQQLLQQRKLVKQESLHLEKQYEVMSIVSEQFKKIFQQPQKNSISMTLTQRKQSQGNTKNQ